MKGVFHEVLKDMVHSCCKFKTTINYTELIDELGNFQEVVKNSSSDVFLPAYGNDKKKYILGQPFISLGKKSLTKSIVSLSLEYL